MKHELRRKAIQLRKKGLTYSEILDQVPVAKSTLSLWLRSVGLSKRQKQRITKKRLLASLRGGEARRRNRVRLTKKIVKKSKSQVGLITKREQWLIGIALYWAEGTKQKKHSPSQKVIFSNSDPKMIKLFIGWLKDVVKIPSSQINFEIIIHETHRGYEKKIRLYWAKVCGFSVDKFSKIYYKKNKINTKRKNVGRDYKGLLRINVAKSTNFNRKISGWIEGVCEQCGVV